MAYNQKCSPSGQSVFWYFAKQTKNKTNLNVFACLPGLAGHRSHGFPHAFPMVAQQVSRVHTTP